ncbi:MAG: hypothetical protein O7E52_25450 [Candidatus Poribacteria bacterium]|nr:hypothetical protein [Candidatus Poribacteria bacterium]
MKRKLEKLAPAIAAAESRTPSLTALDAAPVVDAYPVLKQKREQKPPDEAEMTAEGQAFLLAIEGGKRAKEEDSQT